MDGVVGDSKVRRVRIACLAVTFGTVGALGYWFFGGVTQGVLGEMEFSIPPAALENASTVFVSVECLEEIEEYACNQVDVDYDKVSTLFERLTAKCSDCDVLLGSQSKKRPSRIALFDIGRAREIGIVNFCYYEEILNDQASWHDRWIHVATISGGTVINEGKFSYVVGTRWLMKERSNSRLAIAIDPEGKGYIDPNSDALEVYAPCDEEAETNLLRFLTEFGAIF